MVDFYVSVAFLIVLLIPIAMFIFLLIHSLAKELRNGNRRPVKVQPAGREDELARKRLRVIK